MSSFRCACVGHILTQGVEWIGFGAKRGMAAIAKATVIVGVKKNYPMQCNWEGREGDRRTKRYREGMQRRHRPLMWVAR